MEDDLRQGLVPAAGAPTDPRATQTQPPNPVGVGRAHELLRLDTLVKGALARQGAATVIAGLPGTGKSAVLAMLRQQAETAGVRVLGAAGVRAESAIPFAGLHQLLLSASQEIHRASTEGSATIRAALGLGPGPPPDPADVHRAVRALLRAMTELHPVLLLADDVDWFDADSGTVVSLLATHAAQEGYGIVLTARSTTSTALERTAVPVIELGPVSQQDAETIVRTAIPDASPDVVQTLYQESGGNPAALAALANSLHRAQAAGSANGSGDSAATEIELAKSIKDSLSQLSESHLHVLLVLALEATGSPAATCTAVPHLDVLNILARAEEAGLVSTSTDRARTVFQHPLVRDALLAGASPRQLREAHQALADSLLDQPQRRAQHLAQATSQPDESIAALLEESARRHSRNGEAHSAAHALVRSAELSTTDTTRSARLAEAAYIAAHADGQFHDAEALLEKAAASGAEEPLHAAVAWALLILRGDGDFDAAHRVVAQALSKEAGTASQAAINDAAHVLLVVGWVGGRRELWQDFAAALQHVTPPDRLSPELRIAVRTHGDSVRHAASARGDLEALLATMDSVHDSNRLVRTAMASFYLDRLGDIREPLLGFAVSDKAGTSAMRRVAALSYLCFDDFLTGRWDECEVLAQKGADLSRDSHFTFSNWYFPYSQALVAAGRGNHDRARELADQISQWAAPRGARTAEVFSQHPRVVAAMAQRRFDDAFHHASVMSPPGTLAPYTPHCMWVALDLVEAAVRTGRRREGLAHATAMREANVSAISTRMTLIQAAADALTARPDEVDDAFQYALGVAAQEPRWLYETARISLAYGEWLRRARKTVAARNHLSAAYAAFQSMGARPWMDRAHSELRAAGATTRQGRGEGLTAQEHEVAVLAAQGLTNPKIAEQLGMSPRTVSAHLYRIFPKLQITSRAALRDALGNDPAS
ncbi:AAA family ATPase [Streptomyces sp. NPDC055056]